MLNKMRQSAGSWMIKILLGLVVLAFIFMGAGSFNSGRKNRAATVNGEPISINDYQQTHQQIIDRLRQRFGQRLDNEMLERLNVKKQAMNQVIEDELLRQTAKEHDIRVTSAELTDSITKIPAFQKNGRFNQQQYQMVLNQNRLSPAAFEAMQRQSMLTRKLSEIAKSGLHVSPEEARQWYNWRNAQIRIHYAAFSPGDFADTVSVTEKALKDYYEKHKEQYKTRPQLQARYIKFRPASYTSRVEVSEAEIESYYADNKKQYEQPATVKARHILLKVPRDADPELVAKKREKAAELMEKARSGRDFADLAKAHSEGPSSSKGGDLGTFTRKDMVAPFADKAFSLKPGEISEPVRTRFGWHVIKVEEKTEKSIQPLSAVKKKIRSSLAMRKARDKAYDEAVAMYNKSFGGDDLVQNSRGREDIQVQTTDYFTRKNGPEALGDNAGKFAETAFKLPLMEVSDIAEIGDGYFLIQAIDKKEARIPEFAAVRAEVKQDLLEQEQQEAAREAARKFLQAARSHQSIEQAGKNEGVTVETTGFFQRNQRIPGIGKDPKLAETAFGLSGDKPLPKNPVDGRKGFYVIAFADKKLPGDESFTKEKDRVIRRLQQQKQREYMSAWISHLRATSDIEITKGLIR